jgi:molybdopterin-guanine dinucleotide biosynthesis protein A
MASPGGRPQPLAARYCAGNLAPVRSALERQMPVKSIIEAIGPALIGETQLRRFGDPGQMFFNVNSPEDLRRAEEMLSPD